MRDAEIPPVLSIVGRKNSGKTTLVVALAAELKRRGRRVATVKHGHHRFEFDQPGRDSWRHLHEGGAEAVLVVSSEKVALVMQTPQEEDPRDLIARFYGGRGYDLVLVEGYKHGPFPKIEVFRSEVHDRPIAETAAQQIAASYVAVVGDDPGIRSGVEVIAMRNGDHDGAHVRILADRVDRWLTEERSRAL